MSPDGNAALLGPWDRMVQREPDATAVIESASARTWTFGEIDRLARERAAFLTRQTAKPGGIPVIFREANGAEWLARFLVVLRLEAPALPLDISTPDEGVQEIAARCGAALWADRDQWIAPAKARRYRNPPIALLKLTSGTTGHPKPLPFTAGELAADGRQVMEGMGIEPGRRNFGIIPFGHSYGLGNLVVPLLLKGIPIVCGTSPLPRILAAEFRDGRADVLPAVPSIFAGLVRVSAELPGLRLAITAGAPLKPELARAFRDCYGQPLHNFFGSSETGGIAFDADGEAGLTGRAVGRPLPGVEVRLTPRGRIRVASAAVFTRGNRLRFQGKGEALVADFGTWNERGELVLQGRAGAMIKVGARRLNLAEIENALLQIDGVREAWTTGWSSGDEERPAAVVASARTSGELRDCLRRRLPGWKIPRPLVVVDQLPLTARGKPDRIKLNRILARADERKGGGIQAE